MLAFLHLLAISVEFEKQRCRLRVETFAAISVQKKFEAFQLILRAFDCSQKSEGLDYALGGTDASLLREQ